jgi:hypothetical protein
MYVIYFAYVFVVYQLYKVNQYTHNALNIFNTNGSHLLLFQGFVLKRIKYFVYHMQISSVFEWIVNDGLDPWSKHN